MTQAIAWRQGYDGVEKGRQFFCGGQAEVNASSQNRRGILPARQIEILIEQGRIRLEKPLDDGQLQPASLDLRLGVTAYRVRASFLPGPARTVRKRLVDFTLHKLDISHGAVLETGCVYIVPLMESLDLPDDVAAMTNPKSSTGRLDIFTRVIGENASEFDKIATGYGGRLYAEISPRSFPVLLRAGSRLTQIRFRRGMARLDDNELRELHRRETLVSSGRADIDDGVGLSVDLTGNGPGSLVGYRARHHAGLIDIDKPASCVIGDFWEPIRAGKNGGIILDPDAFYILASKEAVHIPPAYAAEMRPFNPLVGEFRVHYAGFFDPGFGHSEAGGTGSRAVLEVRCHEVPFRLEDGQTIGRLIYERLAGTPQKLYGRDMNSHYQQQGLKLSKHFIA